jgi:hypothetical protein
LFLLKFEAFGAIWPRATLLCFFSRSLCPEVAAVFEKTEDTGEKQAFVDIRRRNVLLQRVAKYFVL